MIVYDPKNNAIPDSEFVDLGNPGDLGGRVISGSPRISARVDFQQGNRTAGVFEATTGVVEIHFPFTEHATILEGEVTLTDQAGNVHVYRKGDSYFIRQGEVILWDVKGNRVRKSFFNIVEN